MKRYVHPLKSFASTPNYVHLYCKPAVEYCEWTEVQALLRAVAKEVGKMRHDRECFAHTLISDGPFTMKWIIDDAQCNCPRGKVLAMLEVA